MFTRSINKIKRNLWRIKQHRRKFYAVFLSLFFAVLLSEAIIRIGSFDWRLISKMLYYQKADYRSHQLDLDPQILYRLRPGYYDYGLEHEGYQVLVNSLGARGPEREPEKAPGIFRIVTVGGSNVYGLGLSNKDTWPLLLEDKLNATAPGRFEVWNFGACAYVGGQMVGIAREAVTKYQPDLVIFALSNGGPPAFLYGTDVKPYFNRDWRTWYGFFAEDCLPEKHWLSYERRIWLVGHVRLYRLMMAYLATHKECGWYSNIGHEEENIRLTREFAYWIEGKAKLCCFLYPGTRNKPWEYDRYFKDTDVPVLELSAEGYPPEYMDIHPPASVTPWYAENIAAWLVREKLIP